MPAIHSGSTNGPTYRMKSAMKVTGPPLFAISAP